MLATGIYQGCKSALAFLNSSAAKSSAPRLTRLGDTAEGPWLAPAADGIEMKHITNSSHLDFVLVNLTRLPPANLFATLKDPLHD